LYKAFSNLATLKKKTLEEYIITYIGVRVRDVSRRLAHEAKVGEVALLALDLLILLWAGGVVIWEVKVAQDSTCSGHDFLKLLLILLISEAILLLVVALVAGVISIGVVVLVGGVVLLPIRTVGDKVGDVTALEAALGDLLPCLQNLCKTRNFLTSRAISLSGMLSYCSLEVTTKEDKANSKADETLLVGLASWPPTRALIIKVLLEREASWFKRYFLDNSWDLSLLNIFSVSRVAKSADSSKIVIFIPHTWSSRV
jgi:hypothetical protein